MFDSYLHGNFGALIASATVENTENFLKAVKEMIKLQHVVWAYHLLKICSVCLIFSKLKFIKNIGLLNEIRNEINNYFLQI